MSKIGKKPIELPDGVTATINNNDVVFKGPKGEITVVRIPYVNVKTGEDNTLVTSQIGTTKQAHSNWGTFTALLANAVRGVHEGYVKELEMHGVGYRSEISGDTLTLHVGFSHPVEFAVPEGISIAVTKNVITITGIEKEKVGQVAADIRKVRKPEPYKGKGIRYVGEEIVRKAGKKAATAA